MTNNSNERTSDRLVAEIVALWDSGQGVQQQLMSKLRKAREAEAAL